MSDVRHSALMAASARVSSLLTRARALSLFLFSGCSANMSTAELEPQLSSVENGVYAGWCAVEGHAAVFKTVLSVGWNPHFEGTKKTVEPHVLHTFDEDFYGAEMRLLIVGYIRPQEKYSSLDELIAAIDADIECGRTALDEPAHAALQSDPSLIFA